MTCDPCLTASACPGGLMVEVTAVQIKAIEKEPHVPVAVLEAMDGTEYFSEKVAWLVWAIPLAGMLVLLSLVPIILHQYIPMSMYLKLDVTSQGHKVKNQGEAATKKNTALGCAFTLSFACFFSPAIAIMLSSENTAVELSALVPPYGNIMVVCWS